MKRLNAILIAIWLGMQMGFTCVVSPILFTSTLIQNEMATQIMMTLFNVANATGLLVWAMAWLNCRGVAHWGQNRPNRLRRWIGIMCLSTLVSLLLGWVVADGSGHFLVGVLGGGVGVWRGSWHLMNIWLGFLGLILAIRLLRLENA